MRIQVLSDLHVDINVRRGLHRPSLADADLLVVAGDTCEGVARSFEILRSFISAPTPIVMVAGNHEFYRANHTYELRAGRNAANEHAITFLENGGAVAGGVRFIGATLWTDYDFFGEDLRRDCMDAAQQGLNDHRQIRIGDDVETRFHPRDARNLHFGSRRFLEAALAEPFAGPTVVVTHHLVHEKSVDRAYLANPLTPAFVSDLSPLIKKRRPQLWIHGHTHRNFDYRVGQTRIVCNPHGYGGENPAFDPALVVEV